MQPVPTSEPVVETSQVHFVNEEEIEVHDQTYCSMVCFFFLIPVCTSKRAVTREWNEGKLKGHHSKLEEGRIRQIEKYTLVSEEPCDCKHHPPVYSTRIGTANWSLVAFYAGDLINLFTTGPWNFDEYISHERFAAMETCKRKVYKANGAP